MKALKHRYTTDKTYTLIVIVIQQTKLHTYHNSNNNRGRGGFFHSSFHTFFSVFLFSHSSIFFKINFNLRVTDDGIRARNCYLPDQ